MKNLINRIVTFAKEKPIVTFVIALVVFNLVLGISAFIITSSASSTDATEEADDEEEADDDQDRDPTKTPKPTKKKSPTPEPTEDPDEDSSDDDESDESEESEATDEASTADESDEEDSTPTPGNQKNINLFGDLYQDQNCSATRDDGESAVNEVVKITIIDTDDGSTYAEVTTDSSGHYSYSGTIDTDSVVELRPSASVPSGYQLPAGFTAGTITFSNNNASGEVLIPLVPDDAAAACESSDDDTPEEETEE